MPTASLFPAKTHKEPEMDADSVIAHYLDLLDDHKWLSNGGLGWSVIRPSEGSTSIERMATQSFGVFPEFREVDFRESELFPTIEMFISAHEGGFCVLERDGIHQRRPEWLRWLSRDAHLWHVSWHPRGGEKLTYAAHGRLLVEYPNFCMDDVIYGDEPEALGDTLRILTASPSAERQFKRAAAMTVVDIASGLRLHGDLLRDRRRAVLADRLIEADPERALSLRHIDPELQTAVAAADRTRHRWLCKLITDRLAQRYFAKFPVLAEASNAAYNRDTTTAAALLPEIVERNIRLGKEWFDQPGSGPREENRDWMRWQAGIATRLAIRALIEDADPSEMLIPAKNALGKGWPEVRRHILSRISTP